VNILGLIPARGGSKAIPRKNIIALAGKPLLAYTCEAALGSRLLTRVLLSTDDQEIADVGLQFGVEAPFLRPSHLAGDDTPILPVIQQAIAFLEKEDGFYTDLVVLLQPTSPFREPDHIDDALRLILDSDADSIVSVCELSHQYNPVSLVNVDEKGYLQPYHQGELVLRRQDKPQLFVRNGPAILITHRSVLDSDRLYGDKVIAYRMDKLESIDIDDQSDLTLAEALIQYWKIS
jgi:CMP-N-acetylneuraminic acid synthetase